MPNKSPNQPKAICSLLYWCFHKPLFGLIPQDQIPNPNKQQQHHED